MAHNVKVTIGIDLNEYQEQELTIVNGGKKQKVIALVKRNRLPLKLTLTDCMGKELKSYEFNTGDHWQNVINGCLIPEIKNHLEAFST